MNIVGQLAETVFVTVKELYRGLNPATLTGGIDVIVVRQPDGSYQCSPFHIRFGKLGVLRSKEKIVDIEINGESVDLHMKLGDNGEAFFVEEEENMDVPAFLCTSPIPLEVPEETDVIAEGSGARKKKRWRKHVRYDNQQRDEANSSSEERDKEEESMRDSDAAQWESLSSQPLLTSKSVYYSLSEEPNEELGETQNRDTHPRSDEELSESVFLSRPDSPKIDSEVLDEAQDLSEPQMQWNWGGFPTPCDPENTPGELKASTHFFPIERQDSFDLDYEVTPSVISCVKPQPMAGSFCLDSSSQQASSLSTKNNVHDALSYHSDHFMSCVSSVDVDSECTVEEKEEKDSSSESIGICVDKSQESAEKVSSVAERVSENGTLSKTEELTKKMAECTLQESSQDSRGQESVSSEQRESDSTYSAPDRGLVPSAGGEDDNTTLRATDESPESSATASQAADTDTGNDVAKSSEASSKLEQQDEKKSKQNHHGGSSDIYLDDLTTLDPEVAELYFPKAEAEGALTQYAEQGSGSQSPQSVDIGAVDSGTEYLSDSTSYVMDVSMSLCGKVGDTSQITKEKFTEHLVTYQDFINNPGIIEDPSLVICINSNYYNWGVAAPMILSMTAFQKHLPMSTVEQLVKDKMSKKPGRWWFSWRRREMDNNKQKQLKEEQLASVSSSAQATQKADNASSLFSEAMSMTQSFSHMYRKSLRLTSKEIESLNLRDGANKVVFSVTTQYQGTCRCEAAIYLWNWNDRVIISDIDGTITKSDALGHILPQFGKDWTHKGIAKLYHKIHKNGYKFLYCSARAIGMAGITKDYLQWVNEQGTVLPKGPVLLAPSSLFSALHREVIEKKPEVFKVACLSDIRDLFGSHKQPFYAAFGNRTNDVFAYKQVGVTESKIFTVNPKGELIQELSKGSKSSYNHLSGLVEHFFPMAAAETNNAAILVCPEYSSFSYWKEPLPEVDISILT
ncbi:phosphatidate phosphatase LPIN2 isoform X2 [Xiphophorus hellerii]|uniref:phosphatidate phosphatase LPIN2 isoform X2 n=1 Tax=Xiphophorus hellerii TaxID=8084 RepID=UPI0013B36078|nr:phosphatidate phosphatase LPIN2-like isoform X2 [Xiphophorus hellerii]